MKLKKCKNHPLPIYALKEICRECHSPTQEAHYKFFKISDAINQKFKDRAESIGNPY